MLTQITKQLYHHSITVLFIDLSKRCRDLQRQQVTISIHFDSFSRNTLRLGKPVRQSIGNWQSVPWLSLDQHRHTVVHVINIEQALRINENKGDMFVAG